jgi:2-(1,2-epoxy-1,2-dihydrophenyl)acetyl-CoA isomerase
MDHIIFEKSDNIGKITLNKPEKFNSFHREMALAMQESLKQCKEDPEIRVILITGEGKAFSAGQDIQEITGEEVPGFDTILGEHYNPIVKLIRSIEKPIVAAVNGVAAGAGANIALACDFVIARHSASFIQAFSKIGLVPDSGGTFYLPRLIGLSRATALVMLGDRIDAQTAENMGLIYKSCPDDQFQATVDELLQKLSKLPTKALGLTKRALNHSLDNDLDTQLAIEQELQILAGQTADYKEGINAFLEKRAPVFRGE